MEKFPRWAQSWMKDGGQVTHGLNLALKLKHPERLPLLLWDIVVARPRIELAMQELSFLHYARFVPSWDGRALMVTTEFDGPLEPYVMDFVIAIGDVFDTLLGYVEDAPRLPVRNHPEEFWRYVQQWNRVPFLPRGDSDTTLFPPDFDFPIYSAYPDKTMVDLMGPRDKLLPPAIDRPGTPVDLADVQGNILRGYRASEAVHMFFTVTDRDKARQWLSTVLVDGVDGVAPAWGGVMSAKPWDVDGVGEPQKPPVMANVALTFAGLGALLPDRSRELDRFPAAFREGAAKRHERNGDIGDSAPAKWRFGTEDQAIHVVLSLYTPTKKQQGVLVAAPALFHQAHLALLGEAKSNGMRLVHAERAKALPESSVYFGYRDGIAHPRISGQCEPSDADAQPASSPGEFLLGRNYLSVFGGPSIGDLPEDLATNGTFGVMRLLEQDLKEFEATLKAGAQCQPPLDEEHLKAKLLGRSTTGDPLAELAKQAPGTPASDKPRNDFDYAPSWEHPGIEDDHEGMRCPVGAHIRRVNPRTARVAGQRHSRRLIRRGMPIDWTEDGKDKKGLLGLFIGASIERQFEFIQREWIQGSLAASGIRGTQDPIAGIRQEPTDFHIPGHGSVKVPPLVKTRGCLYLFFPGISMLRSLGRPAGPSLLEKLDAPVPESASPPDPREELAQLQAELESLKGAQGITDEILQFIGDLLFDKVLDSEFVASLVEHFAPKRPSFEPPNPLPPGDIRPLDPRFVADPYRAYAKLRAANRSVVWVREHGAYWVLARGEAQKLFDNPADFLQQPSTTKLRGIITMDPPRHTEVRKHVQAAFDTATKDVDVFVAEAIGEALRRLQGVLQFDFMPAYGSAVPSAVFWRFFGVLRKDQPTCDALAQKMMRHFGQPARRGMSDDIVFADSAVRLTGRLALMLAKARFSLFNNPYKGTLIGEMAQRTMVPGGLTFSESLITLVQFVLAGYMSMQFLLGTAMRNLLSADPRDPSKGDEIPWRKLGQLSQGTKSDFEAALNRALEEARRVDPPVTIVQRYAARDGVKIGGVELKKDCPVHAVVGSANRDGPGTDLEQFHWDRPAGTGHLSLGHGIHECVGRWLHEKVVPPSVTRLLQAMPDLQLCDPVAVPAWYDNIYFRALQSLPVKRCPPQATT